MSGRRLRRAGALPWLGAGLVMGAGLMLGAATHLVAQTRPDPRLENRMLRQASVQEARGDLSGAEGTLRELLRLQPASSAAVFALERVFRTDGRLPEVLHVLDAHLEVEPEAGKVWALKVGILAETDSIPPLEATVQGWIRAVPASPDPYLEGARAYKETLGAGKAAELIEEGLIALDDPPVLLIALGDVHLSAGRIDDGAEAWARALGRDRARNGDIFRRIEELGADRGAAAARIVAALGAEPTTSSRLEAGAELALREGLEEEARTLVQEVRARLDDREARGFLKGFARKAEDLQRVRSALWAYEELRAATDDPAEGRATDERLAKAALAAGHTATALAAKRRITESHPPGAAERRSAWTEELRIRVVSKDTEAAMEALAAFREEFPGSPELDGLSATLASRLLGRGMREAALEVLNGIEGPGAALERAFLLLEGGALPEGIGALQAALPELEPADATEVLELTLALSELTAVGAGLAARVAIAGHRGHPEQGVEAVAEGIGTLPAPDRPAVLALGARAADEAGLGDAAEDFRRRIVAEHGDAREFAEAALRLARAIASRPGGEDEAVRILESLIVSRPDSPIVPGARRELRRIQAGGGRGRAG